MRKVLQLFGVVLFLSAATTANSQSNYATLSGTVFDPQQQVLATCSVQLTSENTGASRSAITNDLGTSFMERFTSS